MENNSSKQILLSVIGVAILVIAVVGVSFAFFTYSRTGEQDNIITTGSLTFTFSDGQFIKLQNHFPITTEEGLELSGTNNICTFTVTGNAPQGTDITYNVFADAGSTQEGNRFPDTQVFIAMENTGTGFTPAAGLATGTPVSSLTNGQLGTGTITGGASQELTFTVRMWVDSSVVTVGEGGTYTTDAYGEMYYTMKIRVEAAA